MRSMQSDRKRSVVTACHLLAVGLAIALLSAGNAVAQNNTAAGPYLQPKKDGRTALSDETHGIYNSAFGAAALNTNVIGKYNTAIGAVALERNYNGNFNTANGVGALQFHNSREISFNTAIGFQAFQNATTNPTTGKDNTATGSRALASNQAGSFNTATGFDAMIKATAGSSNTATGSGALESNVDGSNNTAAGVRALFANLGSRNTALGRDALISNTSGNNNIAIGYQAGTRLTTGSNNIEIGNLGDTDESSTIRIGEGYIRKTFIAGISGTAVEGADVVVDSNGQLGIVASSARFKRDIRSMGEASRRLMELRPVTFRYKEDRSGELQYGLVAEEVARVYPELVTYGADGKVQTVRYSELSGMLLNELQWQTGQVQKLSDQLDAGRRELAALKADREREVARRTAFEARLSRLEGTTRASTAGGKALAAFDN
jgi:hypothetical protein